MTGTADREVVDARGAESPTPLVVSVSVTAVSVIGSIAFGPLVIVIE